MVKFHSHKIWLTYSMTRRQPAPSLPNFSISDPLGVAWNWENILKCLNHFIVLFY